MGVGTTAAHRHADAYSSQDEQAEAYSGYTGDAWVDRRSLRGPVGAASNEEQSSRPFTLPAMAIRRQLGQRAACIVVPEQ